MSMIFQIADYVGDNVRKKALKFKAYFTATDSQLLEKAKKNNSEAFGELVKRNQDFIFRTALSYLKNREVARDIVQDVFIKAYRGLPYFRDDAQFTTWLYRICKNQCLNIIRHHKLETGERIKKEEGAESSTPLRVSLRKLIDKLSEEYQEIIMLRYFQDLKYDEIARHLGIPVSTVKIRLYRAKRELKTLIGEN